MNVPRAEAAAPAKRLTGSGGAKPGSAAPVRPARPARRARGPRHCPTWGLAPANTGEPSQVPPLGRAGLMAPPGSRDLSTRSWGAGGAVSSSASLPRALSLVPAPRDLRPLPPPPLKPVGHFSV